MRKLCIRAFGSAAVLIVAVCLAGCPSPTSGDDTAQKAADAFTTAHAGVLDKTVETIAVEDEAAIEAALQAYNALGAGAKALLGAQKTLLDSLKTRIGELNSPKLEADAFTTTHAGALAKTVAAVTVADEAVIETALDAFDALSGDAKALLGAQKTLLDSLIVKIVQLKGEDPEKEAADFATAHAGALGKTVDTIAVADETAANDALTAYNALSRAAQGLLADKKALLDSLKAKIDLLKAAADFTNAHAGALAKTVDDVAAADETAVNAALTAYSALAANVKALLENEIALLNGLKARIDTLKAAQDTANAYTTTHATALGKTVETVAGADKAVVDAALAAYDALDGDAKALLSAQKTLLDGLKTKIDELMAAGQEAADAYTAAHTGALNLAVDTVTVADAELVDAALSAFDGLSAEAKSLLSAQKTLLDSLKTQIDATNAAAAFRATHTAALNLTVDAVGEAHEPEVTAALAAYAALSSAAKSLLTTEKTLLDTLKDKIDEIKAPTVAADFRTNHAGVLGKTVGTIAITDENLVDTALAAYAALSSAAKSLLTTEKTTLDALKTQINTLGANAFRTTHAGVLAKTVNTVTSADADAVNTALAAYEALSAAVKALLSDEKTLLDSLKAKLMQSAGNFTVATWINEDGNLMSNAPEDFIVISKSGKDTLAVTAAAGVGNIRWSLNGTELSALRDIQTITIEAASYVPGFYNLSMYAEKAGGIPYQINITFVVDN